MIATMHDAHPELSIRRLGELVGAGRTWWSTHPSPAEMAARDTALRDAIERTVLEFPGYGYRRVTAALRRDGWDVNHKRVLRVIQTFQEAEEHLGRFIADIDNAKRLHSSLGYRPPIELEANDLATVRS